MLVCSNIDDDIGHLIKSVFSRFLYCQDTDFSFDIIKYRKVKVLVPQWCLTLHCSVDCSLPGSSVHGILQARTLEWVAIPFSRGSSRPRNQTWVSCIAGRFFTDWATRESCSFLNIRPHVFTSSDDFSIQWWNTYFLLYLFGEGNGNPLQYSCLENSMDGGAWWATVHGIAESDMTERLSVLYLLVGILLQRRASPLLIYLFELFIDLFLFGICLVAQMVKNLPVTQETWVQSLGWEDPLEEGMAIHSSNWRILMDRGSWWATVHEVTKSQTQLSDIALYYLVAYNSLLRLFYISP